jgi:glycerophosphoryl diester phosphodiesterase
VPVGYAHRGFSLDGTENSIAAFQAAVDLGYSHLETDARVTGDGVAVAFHDGVLDRVTNHTGALSRLSWAELSSARIMGREPIPRLEELLATFGHAQFNIDVKSHAAIGPTLDALRRTNAWHRVRLAAFSHARLVALRRAAGPRVATSLSPREVLACRLGRRAAPAGVLADGRVAAAAQVPPGAARLPLITRSFIVTAHRLDIDVHVWTINDRREMVRLLDLGVDAIMTDRADLLRDVLIERGQWHS